VLLGINLALSNGVSLVKEFRYRYVAMLPATTMVAPTAGIRNLDLLLAIVIILSG
jgi:hypothetical protein